MVKAQKRMVFAGTFHHSIDEKKRVAIPSKWRAVGKGSQEFYVLPDPKNCLLVLPASAMEKMLDHAADISIGEYERRDVLRVIASRAHDSLCDQQGRIALTDVLKSHAGLDKEAVLVGMFARFEIWSPARWAKVDRNGMQKFSEAAKKVGL
jgi:MraZ protein